MAKEEGTRIRSVDEESKEEGGRRGRGVQSQP